MNWISIWTGIQSESFYGIPLIGFPGLLLDHKRMTVQSFKGISNANQNRINSNYQFFFGILDIPIEYELAAEYYTDVEVICSPNWSVSNLEPCRPLIIIRPNTALRWDTNKIDVSMAGAALPPIQYRNLLLSTTLFETTNNIHSCSSNQPNSPRCFCGSPSPRSRALYNTQVNNGQQIICTSNIFKKSLQLSIHF